MILFTLNDEKAYGDQNYTHYVSNWAYSSLRAWMNDDFYNTAFDAEKSCIKNTSLKTPSLYRSPECDADPTNDNVFLLTWDDMVNLSYGFDPETSIGYRGRGTDYARCQGLEVDDLRDLSYWRLRTPLDYFSTNYVHSLGCIDRSNSVSPKCATFGIRPALYVNLQSAISQSLIKKTDSSGTCCKRSVWNG
ncbi:MAG: DUF6273 domain-containing protein [Clostridia bacterium]|nr:DUF6273 domain-containing protein [Clostridia bacterium]